MAENSPKTRFELSVELVKALAWPLFAAVVLILFWGPIRSAAGLLPNIVSRSEALSIAGLSIKIGKGISQRPSDDVKAALSKLSPDDLKRLLNQSSSTRCGTESASTCKADYAPLVILGLMEEIPESELQLQDQSKMRYGYGARLTAKGRETQRFLYDLISQFVQELERAGAETSPEK